MLKGFEDITYELTDYERMTLLPLFIKGFEKKLGVQNAITSVQIAKKLQPKLGKKIGGARVRKIVNYIRVKGLVPGLKATSKGYYVTSDPVEIKSYIESLQGRENEIHRVRVAMEDYLKEVLCQRDQSEIFPENPNGEK